MKKGLAFVLTITVLWTVVTSVRIEVEHLPERCDFTKCAPTDPTKLNVHLVPHTHDDVGWLKTVDQYYYGSHSDTAKAGVQYILDSVVQALVRDKQRRFIYVEVAFFAKWWLEQDQLTRDVVRELVRTGQLEFINGGWVMNDEATTHYHSVIDQMTVGLRFLNDTFGHCAVPRAAWQIDPFGHSREQASLFAQMNFDGLFFSRIDFQDRIYRQTEKTLEHIWQGSDDLGPISDLFTSVISEGYGPPRGFNWDLIGGEDEPVIDNPESEEYNVEKIVQKFVDVSLLYKSSYPTNQILFPMGEDFHYQDANILFKNMDKLIKQVNKRQDKINVFYSTPSCYLKAVHDTDTVFTTKNDDFFPYASDPYAFWTGYFTSRPTVKRMERVGNNFLQVCKQIDYLSGNHGKYESSVRKLKEAMGVMQHHDAVTGTEKQKVALDYAKLLQIGLDQCKTVVSRGLKRLTRGLKAPPTMDYQFCDLLNITSCQATENYRNLVATIYNPLGQTVTNHTVRLPVVVSSTRFIEVRDQNRSPVPSTLFPIASWVKSIPGRVSKATHELVFDATVPPLGFVSYFILSSDTATASSAVQASQLVITKPIMISQGNRQVHFDQSGALSRVDFSGKSVALSSEFLYYEGHTGNNRVFINRSSGAYIFRPTSQEPLSMGKLTQAVIYYDSSRKLYEVRQSFQSFAQQSIRIHPNKNYLEFDWLVGPIPVMDQVGKEVVVRYSTDLSTNHTFYTDANGRQLLKRVWNYRPTWNYTVFEPVSGNYYPINSRILLRDQSTQLTVLTDRSQGGTSAHEGQLEVMLHRRLLHDDGFGVGEALNETTGSTAVGLVARGQHLVLLDHIDASARQHRQLAQQLYLQPIIAFMPKYDLHNYSNRYRTSFSALNTPLPPNVHILTLEQWRFGEILLRLEHFYQANEDPVLSQKVTVHFGDVLPHINIVKVQELTLGANQNIEATKRRLQFRYKMDRLSMPLMVSHSNASSVTLEPMQIRTFLITYSG